VAIDGAAGSGKSTLSRRLAQTLDLPYLNTGLMYRALTLRALDRGVDVDDGRGLAELAREMTFDLNESLRPPELWIDGAPPIAELSSPPVESSVSRVSRHPEVRALLRVEQRRLCEGGGVVEGRDIGTVVAPDADLKVFLSADEAERATRRTRERPDPTDEVARALSVRDALDARTNPLEPAADAVAIDTTGLSADEVFEEVLALVRARLSGAGP
jgi:cytidylate kinase